MRECRAGFYLCACAVQGAPEQEVAAAALQAVAELWAQLPPRVWRGDGVACMAQLLWFVQKSCREVCCHDLRCELHLASFQRSKVEAHTV